MPPHNLPEPRKCKPGNLYLNREESFYILAACKRAGESNLYFCQAERGRRKDRLENLFCLRCNRELENGHKSVAVYMFAQTVGIKPRQKSAAHRICFCPQCSVSLAMGLPPEGALNVAAWDMIRGLVSSDPGLNQAAWESLRGIVGLLPDGAQEEEASPRSRSDTWVNFRRAG